MNDLRKCETPYVLFYKYIKTNAAQNSNGAQEAMAVEQQDNNANTAANLDGAQDDHLASMPVEQQDNNANAAG